MNEEGALRVVHDEIVAPGAPWSARVRRDLTVTLGEIGAEGDVVLAGDRDDVLHRIHIVAYRRVRAPLEEGREHGDADHAALVGDEAELAVALVAGVRLEGGRQAVGVGDRLGGFPDRLF